MKIKINEIKDKSIWDNFLDSHSPNTFLQTWEWGEAQASLHNKIFRLGIFSDDQLVGLAFVYKIVARRGSFLFCPHGPILNCEIEKVFNDFIVYIKNIASKEKVDFIRMSPLIPNSEKNKQIFFENNFREAPVHMMHPELAWILDISLSEEELFKAMKKRHRNSVSRAKREGVEIIQTQEVEDIDKFYGIYKRTADRQNFVPFSKEYVKKEFKIFLQNNKASLFFAYYNNEIIATAIIIFSHDSGFYHHGASIRKYSNIPASEFLQWSAILECKKRGLSKYNFWGIAPENAKNHPWFGLTKFKKGFGGYSEEYLHVKDLPLSKKYWLNYIIETVRKIKKGY